MKDKFYLEFLKKNKNQVFKEAEKNYTNKKIKDLKKKIMNF